MGVHQPSTLPRGLAEVRRIPKAGFDSEVFLIFINHRLEITSIVWAGCRWVFGARDLEHARPGADVWPRCDCRQGSVNSTWLALGGVSRCGGPRRADCQGEAPDRPETKRAHASRNQMRSAADFARAKHANQTCRKRACRQADLCV